MILRLVSILLCPLILPIPARAGEPDAVRKAELAGLLTQDCGSCHGLKRRGGLGAPLTREALASRSDEDLAIIIREGIPGQPMPPWGPLLSDDDIDWIIHLLRKGDSP